MKTYPINSKTPCLKQNLTKATQTVNKHKKRFSTSLVVRQMQIKATIIHSFLIHLPN